MNLSAEILSVGTELLLGSVANTDARDVSQALSELGINVYRHTVVGDNPARLRAAVEEAKRRADILITTGGLGPTVDDLTKFTLAECFGKKLVWSEEAAEDMRRYFAAFHPDKPITENNYRQCYLPEGATIFRNSCGTAPGCGFEAEGKRVLMLPGPPRECRAMLKLSAVPYLAALSDYHIYSHTIRVFGMGESRMDSLVKPLLESLTNPTLAPYALEGECYLRLTARAHGEAEAEALMAPVLEKVRALLGDVIYGVDTPSLEATVFALLRARGLTLAAAESCTGGLIAKRLTDLPGVSAVFRGGAVTYATDTKASLLGVDAALLREKGAVDAQVARRMAEGARRVFGADFGVGVTGVAGPEPDENGNPVGLAYVALAAPERTFLRALHLGTDRARVRTAAANHAFDMLRRCLTGLAVTEEKDALY
ncbi:MAG: competence/damage-inducible protein A [bacterium]